MTKKCQVTGKRPRRGKSYSIRGIAKKKKGIVGWIIFLLRLNPLTSSDIVSYAAGFTRISIVRLMVATGVGMAPLCFLQAWLAEDLLTTFPWLLYPLILTCVAYFLLVIVVIRRMTSGHSESPSRS